MLFVKVVSLGEFYQHNYSCLNIAVHWPTAQLQNIPVQTSPYCLLTSNVGITTSFHHNCVNELQYSG